MHFFLHDLGLFQLCERLPARNHRRRERSQAEESEWHEDDCVGPVVEIDDWQIDQVRKSREKPMAAEVIEDVRQAIQASAWHAVGANHVRECGVIQRVDLGVAKTNPLNEEWILIADSPTGTDG